METIIETIIEDGRINASKHVVAAEESLDNALKELERTSSELNPYDPRCGKIWDIWQEVDESLRKLKETWDE